MKKQGRAKKAEAVVDSLSELLAAVRKLDAALSDAFEPDRLRVGAPGYLPPLPQFSKDLVEWRTTVEDIAADLELDARKSFTVNGQPVDIEAFLRESADQYGLGPDDVHVIESLRPQKSVSFPGKGGLQGHLVIQRVR